MTNKEILKDGIRRGRAVGLEEAARVAQQVKMSAEDTGDTAGAATARDIHKRLDALREQARAAIRTTPITLGACCIRDKGISPDGPTLMGNERLGALREYRDAPDRAVQYRDYYEYVPGGAFVPLTAADSKRVQWEDMRDDHELRTKAVAQGWEPL